VAFCGVSGVVMLRLVVVYVKVVWLSVQVMIWVVWVKWLRWLGWNRCDSEWHLGYMCLRWCWSVVLIRCGS